MSELVRILTLDIDDRLIMTFDWRKEADRLLVLADIHSVGDPSLSRLLMIVSEVKWTF